MKLAPLTGVAFVIVAIIGFVVGGEPPGADSPVQEIVDHYADNKDSIMLGSLLVGVALLLLVFFAGYLRVVLAAASARSMLPALVLTGAAVMAVGGAIDSTISFALAEAVDDIEPAAVQALQALWDNDFIPVIVGTDLFLIAAGLAIVRDGALPRWLGWVALVLAVIGLTPAGFIAFAGAAIWIVIVSLILALRPEEASA